MNRIDERFAELKALNEKALITYITAGDPNLATSEKLLLEMDKMGADFIELGVPFSDPVAEGPTIQAASKRAIDSGTTLVSIFEMVGRIRGDINAPLLLMLYVNTIFRFGKERFFALCKQNGIDGVIVPDLPYEEQDEIAETAEQYGVHSILLVAPTSKTRAEQIAKSSKGFLYCVSSTGVTGTRDTFETDFTAFMAPIRAYSQVPTAIGFGISTPAQAREMKAYADGVIVGSSIVKLVAEHGENAAEPVGEFVRSMKDAL